ncbi:MAG: hypothetical protein IIY05_06800, partial [Alistipes sp.]|nr:hypothetical protein [Alistipes sp.]
MKKLMFLMLALFIGVSASAQTLPDVKVQVTAHGQTQADANGGAQQESDQHATQRVKHMHQQAAFTDHTGDIANHALSHFQRAGHQFAKVSISRTPSPY